MLYRGDSVVPKDVNAAIAQLNREPSTSLLTKKVSIRSKVGINYQPPTVVQVEIWQKDEKSCRIAYSVIQQSIAEAWAETRSQDSISCTPRVFVQELVKGMEEGIPEAREDLAA